MNPSDYMSLRRDPDLAASDHSAAFIGTPLKIDCFQTYAELTAAAVNRSTLRGALEQGLWVLGNGGGISMAGGSDRRIVRFGPYQAMVAFDLPGCELWRTTVEVVLPEGCSKGDHLDAAKLLGGCLTAAFGKPSKLPSGAMGCRYKNVEVAVTAARLERTLTVTFQRIPTEAEETGLATLEHLFIYDE